VKQKKNGNAREPRGNWCLGPSTAGIRGYHLRKILRLYRLRKILQYTLFQKWHLFIFAIPLCIVDRSEKYLAILQQRQLENCILMRGISFKPKQKARQIRQVTLTVDIKVTSKIRR